MAKEGREVAGEVDIEAYRDWIGRSVEAEDVLTARLIHNFKATLDPFLAPTQSPSHAPLALHWCLATLAPPLQKLSPDGGALSASLLPQIPLPRRMGAGGEIYASKPIAVGARVVRRTTISKMTSKVGSTGQLVFVSMDFDYLVDGELALRDRQDVVFREAAPAGGEPVHPPAQGVSAPERSDMEWTVHPSAVLLFRYSALTFNAHRIHYDHPYATGIEGYPATVVQGPLQATLAYNLAAVAGGSVPSRFSYRNLGMLTSEAPFFVKARREADGNVSVWTESATGRKSLSASASWS